MIPNAIRIDESGTLTRVEPERATDVLSHEDGKLWLDLQDFDETELETWLDKLEVRDLSRRLCLEARDRPGFYPLKHEILLVLPVLTHTAAQLGVDHLAFLCRPNLLLTLHRKTLASVDDLASLDLADAWLPEPTIAGLVSAALIGASLDCVEQTARLRAAIVALSLRMETDPDSVEVQEILDLRAPCLALETVTGGQVPSLQALGAIDRPFFRAEHSREYLNCARANLQSTDAAVDRLEKQLNDLRSAFDMHAQDHTNRRLNLLSILSAIFLPITLLASIWGMNFESMPELSLPYAYPIALGIMALVGTAMFRFFRRTGWFG